MKTTNLADGSCLAEGRETGAQRLRARPAALVAEGRDRRLEDAVERHDAEEVEQERPEPVPLARVPAARSNLGAFPLRRGPT